MLKPVFQSAALLLMASLLLASCSSLHAHSDYESGADFSVYQTFTVPADDERMQVSQSDYVSPLNHERIRAAIRTELLAAGYRQAPSAETADFIVRYTVGTRERIKYDGYAVTRRDAWTRHWPYFNDIVEVHSYTEGSLAIDIFDRATRRPIWHGIAKKKITRADQRDADQSIRNAVAAILKQFPPG